MSRTVLITGGNRGIGLELIKQFRSNGDRVIVCCRKGTEELDGLGAHVITNIDVTDFASLKATRVFG